MDDDVEWLQSKLGLHTGVELLYIVDGYEIALTEQDGDVVASAYRGETLRDAIRTARAALSPHLDGASPECECPPAPGGPTSRWLNYDCPRHGVRAALPPHADGT